MLFLLSPLAKRSRQGCRNVGLEADACRGIIDDDMPRLLSVVCRYLFTAVRGGRRCCGDFPVVLQRQAHAGLPKPVDLSAQTGLPDPFVMLGGRRVATREMRFKDRRPGLIRPFKYYME